MLIQFNDELDKLRLVRNGQLKEGLKLDIPEVDQYLRFKPSNFNVILGHANVGKTTVVLYLMLQYTIKHKIKWLVFSSENEPHSLIKKLVEFLMNQPINKISEDDFLVATDFIYDHFKIIDASKLYSFKDLLQFALVVKKQYNYKGFMIDPYNSLIKDRSVLNGISGHEYDYEATSQMRVFCKSHNISIWLNTHANTTALRMKHGSESEYYGHPIPPMASDVEGGGKFVNRADDFIVIHRYIQHPTDWMYSMIHIRKVKDVDTGGRPTPIDSPIKLKSLINNVGFEINGKNLLNSRKREQGELPF